MPAPYSVNFGPGHHNTRSPFEPGVTAFCSVWANTEVLSVGNGLGTPTLEQELVSDSGGIWRVTGIPAAGPVLILARSADGDSIYFGVKVAG